MSKDKYAYPSKREMARLSAHHARAGGMSAWQSKYSDVYCNNNHFEKTGNSISKNLRGKRDGRREQRRVTRISRGYFYNTGTVRGNQSSDDSTTTGGGWLSGLRNCQALFYLFEKIWQMEVKMRRVVAGVPPLDNFLPAVGAVLLLRNSCKSVKTKEAYIFLSSTYFSVIYDDVASPNSRTPYVAGPHPYV